MHASLIHSAAIYLTTMDTVVSKPSRDFGPVKDTNICLSITGVQRKIICLIAMGGQSHAMLKLSEHLGGLA